MTYRVLVTGSRGWTDKQVIWRALAEVWDDRDGDFVVIHGACSSGADAIADDWAVTAGVEVERSPAPWAEKGKAAGFIRNADMVRLGADLCLAFIRDNSRGALHCAGLAEKAGIPVRRFLA